MNQIIYTEKLNLVDLEVIEYGSEKCSPSHSFGPAVRDCYIIHQILSGKGFFRLGKNEYLLKAGDTFLVYPNVVTHFYPDRDDPWHYTWVCFIGSRAEFFVSQAGFELEKPILRLTSRDIIEDCFLKMMLANQLKKGKETYLLGQLHLLLTQFIEGADFYFSINLKISIAFCLFCVILCI